MKIGIISDIHGNYQALKAVLKKMEEMSVEKIYCLGDVVGYYPQINECCDELRLRKIPTLMGNHDWYMAGGSFCSRSRSVNDCLIYQRKVISEENLSWLKRLPIQICEGEMRMVHGGWCDPIDEYLVKPSKEYFDKVEGKLFFSGHTHLQSLHHFGEKTYCNPGSVGQPRDLDPRSAFAVYDDEAGVSLHRVEYDMSVIFELMDAAGFNDYYYGGLKTGARRLCKLPVDE